VTARDRLGEEDPHVRADPGSGDFEGGRSADSASGLEVGKCVQHRRLAVEVSRQPARKVASLQWIETDVVAAGEVCRQDLPRERQTTLLARLGALTPPSLHRGHPPGLPGACVVPPDGIHITPGVEERGVERDLLVGSGLAGHRTRRPVEPCILRALDWLRLEVGQLEKSGEAGVLPT
jgi:hypothetical protein